MKFCPNCGNKLQPGDKFCEKCGYNLTQDSQNDLDKSSIKKTTNKAKEHLGRQAKETITQIQNRLKNIDIPWFKQRSHKWYTVGAILVLVFLIFFVGHIRNNGGSLVAPRNITFSKMNGTRVWLSTEGGKGKGAIVDYIDVTKNGKFIQYQVFDDNITLGKVSKMSNSQLIKLGKEQDKKYFDESINEVKALRDGKKQIGLQDDLMQNKDLKSDIELGGNLYYSYEIKNSTNSIKNLKFISQKKYYAQEFTAQNLHPASYDAEYNQYAPQMDSTSINPLYVTMLGQSFKQYSTINNANYNALIKHMKNTKYLAPQWQKVIIKNKTDDSGNEITSQKVSYNSIDEFNDSGTMDKNFNHLSPTQKQKVANLLTKILEFNADDDHDHPASESRELAKLANNVFDTSYYNVITEDVFKPNKFKADMTLSDPTSQTIYNSRYIGYQIGDDNYLLTKAQNNKQNAVFPKPSN